MSVNYRDATRRSFVNKLAIYLQSVSRDMTTPIIFTDYVAAFTYSGTQYGVVPREPSESPFYPGVNIQFLDEADASEGRSAKKRFIVPVKITVAKAIDGNTLPTIVATEVTGVVGKVLEALSDGTVKVHDYTVNPPVDTKTIASFHSTAYRITDESLAVSGGDIRQCVTVFLNYTNK